MTAVLSVTLVGPIDTLAETARRFERRGADALWTGDYFQSGPVRAAVIAAATERVPVGTHVLQAFARSPLATALAAQELQSLSGGRFVLGLGSQVPAANRRWHGVDIAKPVAALGEYVAGVRRLLTAPVGEACAYDGSYVAFDVPPFRGDSVAPPPVWIGGAGVKTAGLAARAADGLAGHLLWSYEHVSATVRPALQREGFPVTVARLAAPSSVPGWRDDLARRLAHYLVTPAYQAMLRQQGIAIDRDVLLGKVRGGRPVIDTVEPYLDRFCVSDPDGLRRHLAEASAHGVDGIVLVAPAQGGAATPYEAELAELIGELTPG